MHRRLPALSLRVISPCARRGMACWGGGVFFLGVCSAAYPAAQPPPDAATVSSPTPAAAGVLEKAFAARPVLDQSLTVAQAVEIALRESPVVRGAAAEVAAALARFEAARAETRPTVTANTFVSGGSLGNTVESPEIPAPRMIMGLPSGGYADQNLMLMYPLYTGGRLRAMAREADALRGASEADQEARRLDVALLTRTTYREAQAREALVAVVKARLVENEERLRLDRIRLEQLQIPAYYVSRDEAEVASAKQQVTNAQRDVLLSLSRLKTVMGVNPGSRFRLSEPMEYHPSNDLIAALTGSSTPLPLSLVTAPTEESIASTVTLLLRRADLSRPEIRAAGQRSQSARAGEAAARAAYRPQVNAFAMGDVLKTRNQRGTGGITYGLTASFPLYTGGSGESARRGEARAQRRREESELARIGLEVAQEVNDAYLNLTAAEQNIQTAQAASAAAQDEYRAAKARYDAGRSIVTEVLDALAVRVRAESDVVQALFQFNAARDQLLRSVGLIIPPEDKGPKSGAAP